jgi:hypothetical protein
LASNEAKVKLLKLKEDQARIEENALKAKLAIEIKREQEESTKGSIIREDIHTLEKLKKAKEV